jgi:hypothetical protein
MLFASSRTNLANKLPARTAERVSKIRDLLSRALGEVHDDNLRLKRTPSSSPSKRRSEESSESESIGDVLSNLRRGYLVIKHSVGKAEPHNKFVYLSEDNRCLCWKSTDREDEKQLELASITRVIKEGVEHYLKTSRIRDINRCIVVLAEARTLQLEVGSEIEAEYLKYELERAAKHSKSMKLNYKYWKLT